jgi:hypothetical protein
MNHNQPHQLNPKKAMQTKSIKPYQLHQSKEKQSESDQYKLKKNANKSKVQQRN